MKRIHLILIALVMACSATSARTQDALTTSDEVLKALRTVQVSVNFEATPLPDVLEFLADYTRINMIMSRELLDRHQGDPIEVSLQVKDLQLQSLLKLLKSMHDMRIDFEEGALIFKTTDESENEYYTEVYDVRTMTIMLKDFPGVDMALDEQGGMIMTPFDEGEERNAVVDPDTLQDLVIQNCGGDDAWSAGETSIDYQGGMLIIRQTREIHLRVRALLMKLR